MIEYVLLFLLFEILSMDPTKTALFPNKKEYIDVNNPREQHGRLIRDDFEGAIATALTGTPTYAFNEEKWIFQGHAPIMTMWEFLPEHLLFEGERSYLRVHNCPTLKARKRFNLLHIMFMMNKTAHLYGDLDVVHDKCVVHYIDEFDKNQPHFKDGEPLTAYDYVLIHVVKIDYPIKPHIAGVYGSERDVLELITTIDCRWVIKKQFFDLFRLYLQSWTNPELLKEVFNPMLNDFENVLLEQKPKQK